MQTSNPDLEAPPDQPDTTTLPPDSPSPTPGGPQPGGDAGGAAVTDQDSPPAAPPPAAVEPWQNRRIAQLTAQLKAVREQNAVLQRQPPAATAPGGGLDEAEIDRRASQKAAEQDFLRRAGELDSEGRRQFGGEWNSRTTALRQLVNPDSQGEVVAWNNLLIAAMESGAGPAVLHELGGNLDEAQRLLALPVVRQAAELTRLAGRLQTDRTPLGASEGGDVSGVARPVRPVAGRGVSHTAIAPDDPDRAGNLPIEVWMERRRQQVKERGLR